MARLANETGMRTGCVVMGSLAPVIDRCLARGAKARIDLAQGVRRTNSLSRSCSQADRRMAQVILRGSSNHARQDFQRRRG